MCNVYFAPVLRKAKQGTVEASALVPALSVNIDSIGDALQLERGQESLRGFYPVSLYTHHAEADGTAAERCTNPSTSRMRQPERKSRQSCVDCLRLWAATPNTSKRWQAACVCQRVSTRNQSETA